MVALKGIPKVLSPELLFALARMGHGDEIGEHEKLAARPSDRGAILVGALNW
jgi:L-fucose mutarotase/ribose pyranase (RbsD/FucU family)